MKYLVRNTIAFLFLFTFIIISSCVEESERDGFEFDAENNKRAAQVDGVVEDVFSIIENGFVENVEGRNSRNSFFPECTIITISPNEAGGTITLDFGESCVLSNGATIAGLINLNYSPLVNEMRTIDYLFNNFTYNQNGVTGGGEILRVLSNTNGNPQSTINETVAITLPTTDVTASRSGTRIAEWVEGVATGFWLDNVYHITGNWDTNFSNGFTRSGEVTQRLVRKLNCAYLTSGVLEITQNNFTGILDWGDGSCDNQATLEIAGQVFAIIL